MPLRRNQMAYLVMAFLYLLASLIQGIEYDNVVGCFIWGFLSVLALVGLFKSG